MIHEHGAIHAQAIVGGAHLVTGPGEGWVVCVTWPVLQTLLALNPLITQNLFQIPAPMHVPLYAPTKAQVGFVSASLHAVPFYAPIFNGYQKVWNRFGFEKLRGEAPGEPGEGSITNISPPSPSSQSVRILVIARSWDLEVAGREGRGKACGCDEKAPGEGRAAGSGVGVRLEKHVEHRLLVLSRHLIAQRRRSARVDAPSQAVKSVRR